MRHAGEWSALPPPRNGTIPLQRKVITHAFLSSSKSTPRSSRDRPLEKSALCALMDQGGGRNPQALSGKPPGAHPTAPENNSSHLRRREDGSSARCRVGQPRNQTKQKGNSGDGLYNTQAQVYLGRWEESSEPAALPLSPAGDVRPARACAIDKTRQAPALRLLVHPQVFKLPPPSLKVLCSVTDWIL
jgi:hypothetical protein